MYALHCFVSFCSQDLLGIGKEDGVTRKCIFQCMALKVDHDLYILIIPPQTKF